MKGTSAAISSVPSVRRRFATWFVVAVICSLVLHVLFLERTKNWKISGISADSYDMIVPRTFRMKHVEIDPATLEEPVTKPEPAKREVQPVTLPQEKPEALSEQKGSMESVMKAPTIGADSPIAETQQVGREPQSDNTSMNQLLEGSRNAPQIPLDPLKDLNTSANQGGTAPAFSSLDSLLEGHEKLTTQTAPILMPTDLLFGYDSTTLKPEAAKSLEKLGTLITRNAKARFRIEGHTDSFGSDEYNNTLSLRRAEEVKQWLVKTMGIDTARITTAGLGKSHLLAPETGSIEAQQLNRRVEIVITQTGDSSP